jgi:LmbE family N-acetylglucosaminyl deacetylase
MTNLAHFYDAIYLAPHLDDAALSCGGQILDRTRAGQRVLVVTVMAGDPPTDAENDYIRSLHARWELERDAAAQRRAEDSAACAILGADFLHWSIPDCIYRLHPATGAPLYVSDDDIFRRRTPRRSSRLSTRLRNCWRRCLPTPTAMRP